MKILSNIILFQLVVIMLIASVLLTIIGWVIYPFLWLGHISYQAWHEKVITPLWVWLYNSSKPN